MTIQHAIIDFRPLDLKQRVTMALLAHKTFDIDRRLAVALVTLSIGESSAIWLTTNPYGSLRSYTQGKDGYAEQKPEAPSDATGPDCSSHLVGLEVGKFDVAMKEAESYHAARDDNWSPLNFLQKYGMVQYDQTTTKLQPAGRLGRPGAAATSFFYQAVLVHKSEPALRAFSVGPTQMWMGNAGASGPVACGYPGSWDEKWDQYVAGATYEPKTPAGMTDEERALSLTYARVVYTTLRWLRYLTPKQYNPEGCLAEGTPLPNGNNEQESISWLQKHAGSQNLAAQVYNGGPLLPGRVPYRDSWAYVNNIATSIQY